MARQSRRRAALPPPRPPQQSSSRQRRRCARREARPNSWCWSVGWPKSPARAPWGPRRPCAQLLRRPAADDAPPHKIAASLAVDVFFDAFGARSADARPGRRLEKPHRRLRRSPGRQLPQRSQRPAHRRRRRPPPGRPCAAAFADPDVDGGRRAPRNTFALGWWVVREGRVLQSRRDARGAAPGSVARTSRSCRRRMGGTPCARPRWRTPPA